MPLAQVLDQAVSVVPEPDQGLASDQLALVALLPSRVASTGTMHRDWAWSKCALAIVCGVDQPYQSLRDLNQCRLLAALSGFSLGH